MASGKDFCGRGEKKKKRERKLKLYSNRYRDKFRFQNKAITRKH